MKKILLSVIILLWVVWFSIADDFPYENVDSSENMNQIINNDNSAIKQIWDTYVWENTLNEDSPAEYYISKVLNYFLSITWFISFLVLAYWFSLVFTEKSDEWIKKWYKYIKMASIALIIIWLSWLISTWIFYIYNNQVVKS